MDALSERAPPVDAIKEHVSSVRMRQSVPLTPAVKFMRRFARKMGFNFLSRPFVLPCKRCARLARSFHGEAG